MNGHLPAVAVMTLGGTIAMSGDAGEGVTPRLDAAALVAAVPSLAGLADVSLVDFRKVPGASLRIDDVVELAAHIDELLRGGIQGVVVTQGTDTIEETSYCLDLLVQEAGRVVVTGAMRNPTLPGADGPANLFAAVAVAASDADLGGVVVVMNDEVHAARTVRKLHSTLPSAFASPGHGPLGLVVEGELAQFRAPLDERLTLPRQQAQSENVWVPVVPVGLDEDVRLLEAVRDADAVVVEALGAGHVPSWFAEPLGELAQRVPVVLVSRTGGGPILRRTYGFAGSEQDLRARGLVSAGMLSAAKARLLLLLALRSGADRAQIDSCLAQVGRVVGGEPR